MRRLVLMLVVLFMAQMLVMGAASAKYNSQGDITLNVIAPLNAPNLYTGKTTFYTQEAVHNTLEDTTGASVDHSYIWVAVNGQSVLAIDPPKIMY